MADKRQLLMRRIERKKARHQSTVIDQRALVKATTQQIRRECQPPRQPRLL